MKISKATEDEARVAGRKYQKVYEAIDDQPAGEYVKISELSSGKECVTLGRYLRSGYALRNTRLRIRMDAKNNTIYVAKVI